MSRVSHLVLTSQTQNKTNIVKLFHPFLIDYIDPENSVKDCILHVILYGYESAGKTNGEGGGKNYILFHFTLNPKPLPEQINYKIVNDVCSS